MVVFIGHGFFVSEDVSVLYLSDEDCVCTDFDGVDGFCFDVSDGVVKDDGCFGGAEFVVDVFEFVDVSS